MFSVEKVVSKALMALAVAVIGAVLWLGMAATGAAQAATCGPGAGDKLDKSGLSITGTTVSWSAHANACSYRVILKSKSPKQRLDAVNRITTTSYTIPSNLVSNGEKYSIIIKMLDGRGKVAGKGISKSFVYYSGTPPTCYVDKPDKSSLTIDTATGGATWTAPADACGYRVILYDKTNGSRLETSNQTTSSYTPGVTLTSGDRYSIKIKMLDAQGRPAKGIAKAFTAD